MNKKFPLHGLRATIHGLLYGKLGFYAKMEKKSLKLYKRAMTV